MAFPLFSFKARKAVKSRITAPLSDFAILEAYARATSDKAHTTQFWLEIPS